MQQLTVNYVLFFLILWGWFIIFLCHNKCQGVIFFSVILVNLGNPTSSGSIFLRKTSMYVKTPQQGKLPVEWGSPLPTWVQNCCPWGRRGRSLHRVSSPRPSLDTIQQHGDRDKLQEDWGAVTHDPSCGPVRLGKKGWTTLELCLPGSPLGGEGKAGGTVGAPGCLSQQGQGAHWVCTAPVSRGTRGSPPGGICVINLLWAVGEDFLGSSSTEGTESSC